MPIDQQTSQTFHVLKFCSILMVIFGHFFGEIALSWVPVTVGLIIFSFSSGMFTSMKYDGAFEIKKFWKNKFRRLGVNLLVIDIILLVLFIYKGEKNIWTFHSFINAVGLNGFLNWLHITSVSPFGKGMWFFTLLLIFYFIYPLLNMINKKYYFFLTFVFIILAYWFNLNFKYGHALYLTACGFIIGVCVGKNQIALSPGISKILSIVTLCVMISMNFFYHYKQLNFFLILFFSIFFIFSVYDIILNEKIYESAIFFSGCLLEIYLLHPYFFISFTTVRVINFVVSLILILFLAKSAASFSQVISRQYLS